MPEKELKEILHDLNERKKELDCLYKIEEIFLDYDTDNEEIFKNLIKVIPSGWQHESICKARITYDNKEYKPDDFEETIWNQKINIIIDNKICGKVEVFYFDNNSEWNSNPFLNEEEKLLRTITEKLSHYLIHKKLKSYKNYESVKEHGNKNSDDWKIIIETLKKTDLNLFLRISRRMMNHLCRIGIKDARILLQSFGMEKSSDDIESIFDTNKPSVKKDLNSIINLSDITFFIASQHITGEEILTNIQTWMKEDKLSFLIRTLENLDSSLSDILESITRYHFILHEKIELTDNLKTNMSVLLINRFFSDQLDFMNIAKHHINLNDFYDILQNTIAPGESHGKLGGKSAGSYLATKIIRNSDNADDSGLNYKMPKTWYITSDTFQQFIHYNNLEDFVGTKYKEPDQIREEYPNVVQIFKNSYFPPEIVRDLSFALDDFGERPIVVRSSSLLEDRVGSAFSGKYKSLFLGNQGSKSERLNALCDAIAEVYASTFGPDPIEYRKERGLLDYNEEMAIMIQEVVGTKISKYFFPSYAGVAFTNNEFRWSPRIKREDGLIRMVMGLGTRAVDRISDDYPILIAPGQPNINVNITVEEILRYSQKTIDVINLENNTFESINPSILLKEYGDQIPDIENIISIYSDKHITQKSLHSIDFEKDDLIITFNGLITNTAFNKRMKSIMDLLYDNMKSPIDVEFAYDGKDFYILQCRSQSYTKENLPSAIPTDIQKENIIFTAEKFISNGRIPDVSFIVYVSPEGYSKLETLNDLKSVGRNIGKINSMLPKGQFILIGPGRWGSRGDIKLGVPVTYSDINNCSLLIEIAKKHGNYMPDLSFGTHFFQDLVEASIRYLPLYPDDNDIIFNESFLKTSKNSFPELFPEFEYLKDTIYVINIPEATGGKILKILMNAEMEKAVAYLDSPSEKSSIEQKLEYIYETEKENHWRWRFKIAEKIAENINPARFGIQAIYLTGSTKNASADANSDIDFIIQFAGNDNQKRELLCWFEGWSMCISEINYIKTGIKVHDIVDVHLINDKDFQENLKKPEYKTAFESALPLKIFNK
jgi:pyruvate, water dikinase